MVTNPPVITAISSERVSFATYGRMSSGASVWPTKMLAAADSDSAPEVRIRRMVTQAKTWTIRCITPR